MGDKFKWIKDVEVSERAKNVSDNTILQSPDGTMFKILVDDEGILKTKVTSKDMVQKDALSRLR